MEISFQGQFDRASLFRAVRLVSLPEGRNALIRLGPSVIVVGIYAAYLVTLLGKENLALRDWSRLVQNTIVVAAALLFLLRPYLSAYFTAQKLWKSRHMRGDFSGQMSSRGIRFSLSTAGSGEIGWEQFARKRAGERMLALLTAEGTLYFFPRHFFADEEDWKRACQLAEYAVKEAK